MASNLYLALLSFQLERNGTGTLLLGIRLANNAVLPETDQCPITFKIIIYKCK